MKIKGIEGSEVSISDETGPQVLRALIKSMAEDSKAHQVHHDLKESPKYHRPVFGVDRDKDYRF